MRTALALAAVGILVALAAALVEGAENHPQQITVNGKNYAWPKQPVVVVLIDGGDPAYRSISPPHDGRHGNGRHGSYEGHEDERHAFR